MMAYTQENIVSSTQENAENNLGKSRESCVSLGAVQFCSFNYAKVCTLPSTQNPKYNLKANLDQKKVKKKKSKNGKKKEKKKKRQKQNLLDKCFLSDESFKETVNCLEMLNRRCGELVLMCKDSMTVGRLNGFMSIVIEFLKKGVKECLTKPSKACIVKPLLNDIVYLVHLIYSDLKKFNFDSKDRLNYLNKMSDLLAMVIDVEITTSKIFACKKCKGKSFKTEAKLKEHLEKTHKMKTSTEGWWKDDNDSNSNIGILEEERDKVISVLISSLYIYLDNSSNHILDTMLKTTNKNKKKASKICSRIFSRILQSPQQPMSILDYARHILAFKMWKKMLDSMARQREVTRLAAHLLPKPPLYFRERVAVLEGIMPPVPTTKPDSSVTEYCLSDKPVKYELKDQIQKYQLLISNPQKVSELMKKLTFFSENRIDFDVKDSVFAVDDEDMILYDTFPPDSPTKNSTSNKNKVTDKKSSDKKSADRKSTDKKSADKKSADKKSAGKKSSDKKAKSSATVDCQTDSKMVADLSDKTELVTSSNEERDQHQETTIKSEIDIIEVSDAQSNSFDNVCVGETLNCEESTKVNEIKDTSNDIINENITRSLCDDTYQKRHELSVERNSIPKKSAEDESDNAVSQAKLFEIYENLKKVFERPVKPTATESSSEDVKMERIGSPEKKHQIETTCTASSGISFTNKPAFSDETMKSTAQTSSIVDCIDLTKTFDLVGKDMDFQKPGSSVNDLMCEPWQLEFVGEMEKFMERSTVGANVLEGDDKLGLKTTFKEEVPAPGESGVLKGEGTRETTSSGLTLKEEEEEKRRICNLEDDFITELFSEQPGQSEFGYLMDFLNSPIDDLSLINNVEPPPWSNDGTSQPLLSLLMDEEMDDLAFTDASDIVAITDRSSEERFIIKDNIPSPKKTISLESELSLPPNEPDTIKEELFDQKSHAEKRALGNSNDDYEEPQMKRSRSSSDAHNYLLTPPSTPVASESAKNQVESQKDASSTSQTTTSENSANSSPASEPLTPEIVNDTINEAPASPAKQVKENRPSSPSKNVNSKHCVVDRPKDSAKDNLIEKPTISTPECTCDQRLSGSMIDSYFTYFHRTVLSVTNQERTYIFSVSFYPLLTSDSSKVMKLRSGLAEKRHSQVENITRNVNIFEKDFIIFPIEKHGHWLVVIVCFPGLSGPVEYQQKEQIKKHFSPKKNLVKSETATGTSIGKARRTRLGCNSVYEKRNSKETADCDMGSNNKSVVCNKTPSKTTESNQGQEDRTSHESQPIKQPCILVFDSSPKPRKSEVVEVIRDYLRVEYKVKHGKDKDFSTFMKDSKPKVPTRKNSACCGVYMLQYADSFFNNPIVDFRLPIKHIQNWFPSDAISRKRDEIFRFLPRPSCELTSANSASQMLHVKSCQKGKTIDQRSQRRSSEENCDSMTVTKDSLRSTTTVKPTETVLDSFRAVAVLEDCNTSDDFRGFDFDQPLDGLLSPDHRTSTLTADLIIQSDDDNAMMNVINEEEVITSKCTMSDRSNVCSPELIVALSRSDYVPSINQEKKKRNRTRTATALIQKKLSPTKRKNNVSSENLAASQNSTTTSKKSEPANKAANKGEKPKKRTRKSMRRRKVVSSPPKSVKSLRSTSNEGSRGKDDNSNSMPLRPHPFNEVLKKIEKLEKMNKNKGRRCRK